MAPDRWKRLGNTQFCQNVRDDMFVARMQNGLVDESWAVSLGQQPSRPGAAGMPEQAEPRPEGSLSAGHDDTGRRWQSRNGSKAAERAVEAGKQGAHRRPAGRRR